MTYDSMSDIAAQNPTLNQAQVDHVGGDRSLVDLLRVCPGIQFDRSIWEHVEPCLPGINPSGIFRSLLVPKTYTCALYWSVIVICRDQGCLMVRLAKVQMSSQGVADRLASRTLAIALHLSKRADRGPGCAGRARLQALSDRGADATWCFRTLQVSLHYVDDWC